MFTFFIVTYTLVTSCTVFVLNYQYEGPIILSVCGLGVVLEGPRVVDNRESVGLVASSEGRAGREAAKFTRRLQPSILRKQPILSGADFGEVPP